MKEELTVLNLEDLDVEELEHRLELGVVPMLTPGATTPAEGDWPGCDDFKNW